MNVLRRIVSSKDWIATISRLMFFVAGYTMTTYNPYYGVGIAFMGIGMTFLEGIRTARDEQAIKVEAYKLGIAHAHRRNASR